MSCCVSKYDLCILQQETFKSPTFVFENTDISNDSFGYKVYKFSGATKKEFPVVIVDENTIYIEDITMPIGDYIHELIWERDGKKEAVFQGALKVTDKGTNCGCSSAPTSIKVNTGDEIVNVSVEERIINNFIWSGSVLHFEVNENMELVMYETVPTALDFELTNGYLTLEF